MIRTGAISLFFLGTMTLLFAQDAVIPAPEKPRAPMEFLGMGPEMFSDRACAWVEAFGKVCEQAIAKLGIIALAILAVWRNIITNAEIKGRLARQSQRIDQVALAVPAAGDAAGTESDPIHTIVANPPEAPANVTEVPKL